MSDRVTVAIDGGVADVRLNRPDKLNALDPAMFRALAETGEALKSDSSVRAVVLSGEGRAFCAGLDFGSFQSMAGGGTGHPKGDGAGRADSMIDLAERGDRITNLGQHAAWVWTELPVPVIAAITGAALGGGLQVAMGADIRIVTADAQLSVLEIRWGLTPDMTGTHQLARLVGLDVAKELTFTGRMVSGEEAVRIGLATRVADDPRAAAFDLAADIAAKSPHAVRGAKRLFEAAIFDGPAEHFLLEERTIRSLIGSPNQVEAVTAYFEKREPVFTDPE